MGKSTSETAESRCAVRLAENSGQMDALDRFLRDGGPIDAVRFEPREDHDLDDQLSAGRFERVIFCDLDALLTVMWKGHAAIERWHQNGVKIDFVEAPYPDPEMTREVIRQVNGSFSRHREVCRRRQIQASVILSLIALASMAILFLLVPPAK